MQLQQQMQQQGNWLFRRRGFLPLFLLPVVVPDLWHPRPSAVEPFFEPWQRMCLLVSLSGLLLRCLTVGRVPQGTSGRNTCRQIAEQLNTRGVYSLVRHPLYLGNFLIGVGVALVPLDWRVLLIYALAFWIYYERIMVAEEAYLRCRFGSSFENWAARTPAVVPRWALWQPSSLRFSLRTVLRREYTTLLLVVLLHATMDAVEAWSESHRLALEPFWAVLLLIALGAYVALRTLKKKTTWLHVPGR